jgi:DNA-binding NarL/FixJ family response regulator
MDATTDRGSDPGVITVALAEDSVLVREGLRAVLSAAPDMEVIGSFATADELRASLAGARPNVVVTDIRMPPGQSDEGIRLAHELRRDHPGIGVVVVSSANVAQYAIDLLDGGSQGRAYVLKDRLAQPGELVHAVREVAAGGSVIDPTVVEGLIRAQGRPASSPLTRLSPRETEVLQKMALGHTNTVIAQDLFLTVRGVERHINSIFAKLNLNEDGQSHHRVRAVLLYLSSP